MAIKYKKHTLIYANPEVKAHLVELANENRCSMSVMGNKLLELAMVELGLPISKPSTLEIKLPASEK